MNKNIRIKKRKERRYNNKLKKLKQNQSEYTFDKVFTFQHFMKAYPKCLKGVHWKASVQNYIINSVLKLYNDFISIRNRELPNPVSDKEICARYDVFTITR